MANIFESDLILPGVITEIVPDYSAGYDSSTWNTTESVTVIGTAFNGPVGRVTPVYTPEYAKYVFGDSFDPKTRREATLIPEIYDAWARGCRTIYAIRVGGIDIYKDFNLAVDTDLMFRVRGSFPSNQNKDVFLVYEAQQANDDPGVIKIYKPAARTILQEKMQGVVDSLDSILVNEIKLSNYGISKGTRLIDVIDTINTYTYNNVINVELVNKDGVALTSSSAEVQELSLGALFPGIYCIGRDRAASNVIKHTDIDFIRNSKSPLFAEFSGEVWKKLIMNTDVAMPYPIFGENLTEFTSMLVKTGIVPDKTYTYLKELAALDKIALKDKHDYENVNMNAFELYKELGGGFGQSAKVVIEEKFADPTDPNSEKITVQKVVPVTDSNDPNKVVGITDGIYSMLQNHETNYTVLSCATAETKISGSLPKRDEFKEAVANSITIHAATGLPYGSLAGNKLVFPLLTSADEVLLTDEGDTILATGANLIPVLNMICKIRKDDFKQPTRYDFSLMDTENSMPNSSTVGKTIDKEEVLANLLTKRFKRVPVIDVASIGNTFECEDGQLALLNTSPALVIADESELNSLTFNLKKYNSKSKKFESLTDNDYIDTNLVFIADMIVGSEHNLYTFSHTSGYEYKLHQEEVYKYLIAESNGEANIYYINSTYKVEPLCSLHALENTDFEDDYTTSLVEGKIPCLPSKIALNSAKIKVISSHVKFDSYADMLERLAKDTDLAPVVDFEIIDPAMLSDDCAMALIGDQQSPLDKKNSTYNVSKYIPYTSTDNFARQLAQHCMYTSLKTYPTHGIIGCGKLTGITLSTVAQRVNEVLEMDLDLYAKKSNGNNMLDNQNLPYPIGRCLSVTFMQYAVTTGNGYNYVSNGAAGYAGTVSTLPADRTSTNQPIQLPNVMFELSNYQLSKLNTKGIVTCKRTTQGLVITDGVTCADAASAYRRLSTSKVINIVAAELKRVIEPFIGLQDTTANKNSLNTAIKSLLTKLKGQLIEDYDFSIATDPEAAKLGIVKINYVIIPANEIREVRNSLSIQGKN